MKYKIATALGLAALIIPAGMALADDGHRGLGLFEQIQAGLHVNGDADDNDASVNANASTSAHVDINDNDDDHDNATSTERKDGQRGDKERSEHATTSTTTKEHGVFGKGGLPAFLRWIFGLPASTTIGDIKAQIVASSSASTTMVTSTSQGLGFWAHLFGFLHLGK